MSTLWTPDGERPIRRDPPSEPDAGRKATVDPAAHGEAGAPSEPDDEAMQAQLQELRDQLARTPAVVVVVNHAFGLFELAALHLSLKPPQLDEARLAIDALGALVDGMPGRLGEHEKELKDGLAQLRIAFVQVKGAHSPS